MTPASPDEKQNSAFAAGAMVGAYRIESELGRGGMGVVYKAVHTGLNKPVAIKVMGVAFSANKQAIDRLMAEGRTLAKLQHPNVVSITDCGEFNGLPFLVLEFLEGGTVEAWLQRSGGRLPVADVRRVLADALAGLRAAHEAKIIHRDLKPSNFLIDGQGRIRISDFGLAQAFQGGDVTVVDRTILASSPTVTSFGSSRGSATGPVGGTVQFMAPELHGGSQGDERSDLFALGVMTYYLLTGRKPAGKFVAASKLLPGLPRSWDAFIDKCIAQQPDDRYQTAAAALAALPAAGGRAGGGGKVALLAVLLAAGLGGGAWWLWGRAGSGGGGGSARPMSAEVRFRGFALGDQVVIPDGQSILVTPINVDGTARTLPTTRRVRIQALREGAVLFDREFDFAKEEQRVVDLGAVTGRVQAPAADRGAAVGPVAAPPPPAVSSGAPVEVGILNVPPEYEVAVGEHTLRGAGAEPLRVLLPVGPVEVRLLQQGRVVTSQVVEVAAGAAPIDAGGWLALVDSQVEVRFAGPPLPADAELWIDGLRRLAPERDGRKTAVALLPGRHVIELRGTGLRPTSATVEVVERQPAVASLEVAYHEFPVLLKGLPAGAAGTLGGRAFAAGIDGTARLEVPYGRHVLAMEAPLRERFQQEVEVKAEVTLAPSLAWQTQLGIALPGGGTLEVRRLEAGEYRVGSRAGDPRRQLTDLRERTVSLDGCYIAVAELTRGQYEAILGVEAQDGAGALGLAARELPVTNVSGRELFKPGGLLAQLNRHLAAAQPEVVADLPTEDEWEAACLARSAGTEAAAMALPMAAAESGPIRVTDPVANPWGFRGMVGNVAEFTRPAAAAGHDAEARLLVLRGGSWQSGPAGLRPQARIEVADDVRLPSAGVRLVFRPRAVRAAPP